MDELTVPLRASLASECVRVIRGRIESGEWTASLPGERRLVDSLQVCRHTVRQALQQLEEDGLVSASTPGARREILAQPGAAGGSDHRLLRIGMLSPWSFARMERATLLEVDQIRAALAKRGGTLEVFAPAWYHSQHPGRKLGELLNDASCQT